MVQVVVMDDNQELCKLIKKNLQRADIVAETFSETTEAILWLQDNHPKLLLLDYYLLEMTGEQFLSELKQLGKQIPFIIMTGNGDERIAVEMMKQGAEEYIVKDGNFLNVLPSMVHKVLAQIDLMEELEKARTAQRESEQRYEKIFNNVAVGVVISDSHANIVDANDTFCKLLGYTHAEIIGKNFLEMTEAEDYALGEKLQRNISNEEIGNYSLEHRLIRKDENSVWVRINIMRLTSEEEGPDYKTCVIEDISEQKKASLQLNQYMSEIELKNKELEIVYEKINEEVNKAIRIHRQFLPEQLPDIPNIEIAALYQPAAKMGGDYYNIVRQNNQLIFYLVDVSGHGLDGAMLSIFIREKINSYLFNEQDRYIYPKNVLKFLNVQYRLENFFDDYFVCVLVGTIDIKSEKVTLANAGIHVLPLLRDQDGSIQEIEVTGMPITDVIPINDWFVQEETVDFNHGDALFISTDGLIEERVGLIPFGAERVKRVLKEKIHLPAEVISYHMNQSLTDYIKGNKREDDVTHFVFQNEPSMLYMEFEISSEPEELGKLRDRIDSMLQPYIEDAPLFSLAIYEIGANAIEHGNRFDGRKKVFFRIHIKRKYIVVQIEDQGQGFDWETMIENKINVEKFHERGMGIPLAKMNCDYISYANKGTRVTLTRRI